MRAEKLSFRRRFHRQIGVERGRCQQLVLTLPQMNEELRGRVGKLEATEPELAETPRSSIRRMDQASRCARREAVLDAGVVDSRAMKVIRVC
jgi:hypothetical protein